MKKRILLLFLTSSLLLVPGCQKDTSDDIYGSETEIIQQNDDSESDVTEGKVTENNEEIVDLAEETTLTEEIDTTESQITETLEEDLEQTPVEDVYESASEPITFDISEFEGVEPLLITDEEITDDLEKYLYNFYFNYYFTMGLEEETGNVGIDAMTLFALSYIMQNENEELKFEWDTYTLYIPMDHVRNVVAKYFYRDLDVFNVYEDLNILFDDEIYTVVVEDGAWDVDFKVSQIEKLGDFTYKVTCDITSKSSGRLKEQVEAIVDESHEGHVLINYSLKEIEE